MQYRRFGRTELSMPVISCGGMRFQQSWNTADTVSAASQRNVRACIHRALDLGITHIETARGYGTSEAQLGTILPGLPRQSIIVQTKVAACPDPAQFAAAFEESMGHLRLNHLDLFAFHGVNSAACLGHVRRCLDTALRWKKEGQFRHLGLSTHAPLKVILEAIEMEVFDYINLHYYYINQDNWPAIEAARRRDMGVFIISPNDKGGMLYDAPQRLCQLTEPLHPMVFNGLYCLARPEVHTLSCGVARPEDFDAHLETVRLLDQAKDLVPPIVQRLDAELERVLGRDWATTWHEGLPDWDETPGEVNIPVILRLYNLARAFDMLEYGKMRYNLLGNGGTWFPGRNAAEAGTLDLRACLSRSPHRAAIRGVLAAAHEMFHGEERTRLQSDT